jgi:hypothetical protein
MGGGNFLISEQQRQLENFINGLINQWWESPQDGRTYSRKYVIDENIRKNRDNESQLYELICGLTREVEQLKSQAITQQQVSLDLKSYEKRMSVLEKQSFSSESVKHLIRQETEALKKENEILKEEIEKLKKQIGIQQQPLKMNEDLTILKVNNQQNSTSYLFDQTIESFNAWAKNPGSSLPPQFNYAEGDLKLREKQNIQSSSTNNAAWIMNKSGSTKYVFPNPNAIDQLSGKIDTLYTVTGNRRARGQNKVNIQNACVIKEDGWIEYKGALTLI